MTVTSVSVSPCGLSWFCGSCSLYVLDPSGSYKSIPPLLRGFLSSEQEEPCWDLQFGLSLPHVWLWISESSPTSCLKQALWKEFIGIQKALTMTRKNRTNNGLHQEKKCSIIKMKMQNMVRPFIMKLSDKECLMIYL